MTLLLPLSNYYWLCSIFRVGHRSTKFRVLIAAVVVVRITELVIKYPAPSWLVQSIWLATFSIHNRLPSLTHKFKEIAQSYNNNNSIILGQVRKRIHLLNYGIELQRRGVVVNMLSSAIKFKKKNATARPTAVSDPGGLGHYYGH